MRREGDSGCQKTTEEEGLKKGRNTETVNRAMTETVEENAAPRLNTRGLYTQPKEARRTGWLLK